MLTGDLCAKHPEAVGKRSKDGRCTKCESERRMEYRARNLEKELARRAANRARENELARLRHAENPEPRRESVRKWQQKNPDKVRESNVATYHADPEYHRARVDEWRKANPQRLRERQAVWRKANPDKVRAMNSKQYEKCDKQKRASKNLAWQRANKPRINAYHAKRKAATLRATPSWANDFFVEEAYDLAVRRSEATGFKWHVDHIVPLQSRYVCGLHCESNLRVIPGAENSAKSNRHWPDMPERSQPFPRNRAPLR